MRKILFLILFSHSCTLHSQENLKNTYWIMTNESPFMIPMSELPVLVFTKCADLSQIQTEGRTILSFEDFVFVYTYHPATQTQNMLTSFRYEFLPDKNQLHIQYDLNRSGYYTFKVSQNILELTLVQ